MIGEINICTPYFQICVFVFINIRSTQFHHFNQLFMGCTKLRNEIETKRTKRNEAKYYETQRNILKCETKRKYTKIQKEQHEWNEK